MKKCGIISVLFAIMLVFTGCGADKAQERTFTSMDTIMVLRAYGSGAAEAIETAEREIESLDRDLDALDVDSCIGRLNADGIETVTDDALYIIDKALEIGDLTDEAFDITIAPVMELWDFENGGTVPSESDIASALDKVNYKNIGIAGNNIELQSGMKIDLGGIAKGYAGDKFREVMANCEVESAMAYLGGNVALVGVKPDGTLWRVAIQDPQNENERLGVISAHDCSIVTSGGYQRYFECDGKRYHHIIDPKTGYSADSGLTSVTVISDDGTRADGLSTALFVMGEEKALELWRKNDDFELVLVTEDGRVLVTLSLIHI